MNRPRWLSPESLGDSGDEALQSDVMRFMAILGLCLTAIFALVQSIPLTPTDPRPEIKAPGQWRLEIESLKAEAADLHAELARLLHRAQAAEIRDATLRREAETRVDELARLGREVEQRRRTLQRLEAEYQARSRTLSELRRETASERQALARLRREVALARAAVPAPRATKDAEPEAKPEPEPAPAAPVREGFSLRFSSDTALVRLVRDGRVNFFALAPGQAWRLTLEADLPRFSPAQPPRQFHEMTPESVPASLVQALQRGPGIHRRERVTWAVQLPENIAQAIRHAMSDRRGGTLLIGADGSVHTEGGAP